MNPEIDFLEMDNWYRNQLRAKTDKEFNSLGDELVKFMKSVTPRKDKNGYISHFFMHEKGEDLEGFFYNDSPMNESLAKYIIEKEKVKYIGKKRHQGKKYKSWTFQDNQKESENNLIIRKEISPILDSKDKRKYLIRSAIELSLDRFTDMYLSWMFKNKKFTILSGGLHDYKIREKGKEKILRENVCEEFIQVMDELVREEKIKIFQTGYVLLGKNFKRKPWEENENNPALPFILEEEK